ncbi:response regulator [Acidovorax sp.]|uniref:response regulator n=1 Tax=Acidovorax sp. TaxID=1872122 RepID=UPI00391F9ED9
MGDAFTAAGRRVLLVEDDASIARFIDMALEDLGLELTLCADVEAALASLRHQPARLIITDLMLPGLSGYDFLDRLHAEPALCGDAKVVIFSAGLGTETPARLDGRSVWRTLRKPASVAQLRACVQDALDDEGAAQPPSAGAAQDEAAPSECLDGEAIAAYFGGDAALFRAYRAKCLAQFPHDLAAGDAALQAAELAALQRLSHSLATVFRTLGWAGDSAVAKQLEAFAAAGDASASAVEWGRLRSRLAGADGRCT